MIQLYQPLNYMGVSIATSGNRRSTSNDVCHSGSESGDRDRAGAKPLAVTSGRLLFENVSFHYDPRRAILKDVSFEVSAGKTVAVVGPSGAGKSTLSRLIFRFYEPSSGRITIDGQDIAMVTQTSLRAAIGMVPQDTVLFNDTIAYNIRYGRSDASDAEVREAARLARIDHFIEQIPGGYEHKSANAD